MGGDGSGYETEADVISSPAFGPLQDLINVLEDGVDHPEVYRALEGFSKNQTGVRELRRLIGALRPGQTNPSVLRAFDVVAALLLVFRGEKAGGVALLRRLQHERKSCVQIAGALFYAQRFGTEKNSDLSGRFCRAPFERFETLIDGTVAPCCSLRTPLRLGHLDQGSFDEIWNSGDAQAMRRSILDGSYRYCNKQLCPLILEDRLPMQKDVTEEELQRAIRQDQTELDTPPTWLLLAHDPTCNLACPSCRDGRLVADEAQKQRFDTVEEKVLRPLLAQSKKATIRLDISGQGDPWSSSHYRSLLRTIADGDFNLQLYLHTNGLLMSAKKWEEYQGLEKYQPSVDVSIDACTPWVYEVLRRPGNWDRLDQNLRFIGRLYEEGRIASYQINATVQVDNYHQMGDLFSYAQEVGAPDVRLCMIQNTGAHLTAGFARKNVAREDHPLHVAFLETLRDPRLGGTRTELYDVRVWRDKSTCSKLPSDLLPEADFSTRLAETIERARMAQEHSIVVALCASAHVRSLTSPELLLIEAESLDALGFPELATYRRQHAACLNPALLLRATPPQNDNRRHLPLVQDA